MSKLVTHQNSCQRNYTVQFSFDQ